MTLSATNFIVRQYLKTRQKSIQHFMSSPMECQQRILTDLLSNQQHTNWGKQFKLSHIRNQDDFSKNIPISRYEDLQSSIELMIEGHENVLVPDKIYKFAKSSGTSTSKSKYIPLAPKMLSQCHDKASWDLLATIYQLRPETKIFVHKNLIMAGSVNRFEQNPDAIYGDISAITLNNLPPFSRPYYTPDFETALLDDWEDKLEKMVRICSEEELAMIAGVPSWTLILFQKIMAYKGVGTMDEIWKEASIYIHGGVGFEPYRKSFHSIFPSGKLEYMEVYNASEGFFAFQNDLNQEDLLLMLDHGIYYEFIPSTEFNNEQPETIQLKDVELDKVYSLVISTYSGLTRYRLGDTIKFTSLKPYKIKVVGREKQFINAFGEELMVHNAERALATTCDHMGINVREYTVAPLYITDKKSGAHQWLIEFDTEVNNQLEFATALDHQLQLSNSDYKAKRANDLAMESLKVTSLPRGTFLRWMKKKGKLGGQHKVPRLSNNRNLVEEILALID